MPNQNKESVWPVYMNDVNCTGSEESIWDCPHNGITGYSCNHREDASVICHGKKITEVFHSEFIFYNVGTDNGLPRSICSTGDVRLVGGGNEYQGTVEVCINQVWGRVCSYNYYSHWTRSIGQVACGQLGYQRLGATHISK